MNEHTLANSSESSRRIANATILAGWVLICMAQILAALTDGSAEHGTLQRIILRTLLANAPFAIYSFIQFRSFMVLKIERLTTRFVLVNLLLASVLYFVPLIFFQASINPIILGSSPWSSWPKHIAAYPSLLWTFDYLVFAGCFAATLAPRIWIGHREAEIAKDAALRDNLHLRLSLQQQQLKVLQLQLEPHFLFNALNAISALVRGDDKRVALSAIATLSNLLRYSVQTSDGIYSTVQAELDAVRDYLVLQGMRFGGRLTFTVKEAPESLLHAQIPALLLQPLVENAIRHDLECHTGSCDIELSYYEHSEMMTICVTNTLSNDAIVNHGSGVGLKNLRERIGLLYRGAAHLETTKAEGRFIAKLTLPKEVPHETSHTGTGGR
jgi:two-component system sensor histidine kinase AlgZ